LPGIPGMKTEKEKFAGAVSTEKIHYMLPNGRVIEGPCFHYDGQNFAKAYDIKFLNHKSEEDYVYQNTWAITTRMLGTMFTIHSDDKGLVIPPKLCKNQLGIVPILIGDAKAEVLKKVEELKIKLKEFNPLCDLREDVSPGRKFASMEMKGIPLRVELGPRDLEAGQVVLVKRNGGDKEEVKFGNLRAEEMLNSKMKVCKTIEEAVKEVKGGGMASIPFSKKANEDKLKEFMPGLKSLFIDEKRDISGEKCVVSGKKADYGLWIGRTY